MKPIERAVWILSAVAVVATWGLCPARAEQQAQPSAAGARELFVTVGKSLVVESPVVIQRVSVANPRVAEAVVVNPKEVVVNGLAVGETSLILWQQGGNRILFDLRVRAHTGRLDAVREQLKQELAGQEVSITPEGDNVFLRGTVKDLVSAERAVTIAGTLGKPVNLLHVKVPPVEQQVLLKVRFANVDRAVSSDLGANFFFPGALNTQGAITAGGFSPPRLSGSVGRTGETEEGIGFTLTDALNVFLFRADLNLGATIRALQSKRLLELLAEPNLLAINGKQASFLAGGEFPVPIVQAGIGGAGAISIQWREFGVRLNFVPTVTPRGTIRLQVEPEVSSLDYANAVVISGFTVPAISTRRVQTEIELESGQSFAIAGLLDNRMTESLSKIPGIGDIPLLGKLFQSRSLQKNNTELLVVVTPDVVRPIPTGQPVPGVKMPAEFLSGTAASPPRTPDMEATGPVPVRPPQETVPVEQLQEKPGQARGAAASGVQYIPVLPMPMPQPQAPSAPAAPQPVPATPQP